MKFGLSCDRFGLKFGLSCDSFGIQLGPYEFIVRQGSLPCMYKTETGREECNTSPNRLNSHPLSGCKFGLSCDRFGVNFEVSCARSGVTISG